MSASRVAVVGGGLAGITAALDCADAGAQVTLFESRPRLGGATFSIARGGYSLDNGQHIALRCCTAYRSLLHRLGVDRNLEIQPRLHVPVLRPGARPALLARSAAPAPFHLLRSLIVYHHLSPGERLQAVRAIAALRTLDLDDASLDALTFGDWLRARGQSERAIARLWNLIALPTLNLPADEASLQQAAFVFRVGLLDDSDACDLALPTVPLGQLHGEPAAAELRARGVALRLRTRVRGIVAGDGVLGVTLADDTEEFDRVVSALPHHAVGGLLPAGLLDSTGIDELGSSPIVNVHLRFDRRVLATPVAAVLDSPLQWLFDRTSAAGLDEGQLVSISLSHATNEIGVPQQELVRRMTDALGDLLPAARAATVVDANVTREPNATFKATPGSRRHRPQARTAVRGLALAGAWTDTGWPATMEGAVRSGHAAASVVLAEPAVTAHRTSARSAVA